MTPPEMTVLLRLMDRLAAQLPGRDCDDILEALDFYRGQVKNDFSAKAVCRQIAEKCHPKAWGDRFVTGMNHAEWIRLLQELRAGAVRALDQIERRQTAG